MNWCSSASPSSGFVSSVVGYVDCQADRLGSAPYQALSAPGSTLSVVLTGFLTIFIALMGYNLLLGRSFTVRSGTLAAVKVGAVFALATNWTAYRTLAYDVVTEGPAQIVTDIGGPTALPGTDGTLLQRLDLTDAALVQLSILGTGVPATDDNIVPPPFAGFNAFALGGSRILFLLTAIAGLGSVRILAAMMLALGPFFIAFMLFDSTRSLFEGWIRVLTGAAVATVGVTLTLSLMLALVEPWLAGVVARRVAGEGLPSVPTELFVITCLFAVMTGVVLGGCMRVARAFRLPPMPVHAQQMAEAAIQTPSGQQSIEGNIGNAGAVRTRAQAMADAMLSNRHRETVSRDISGPATVRAVAVGAAATTLVAERVAVGRSFRRTRPRTSASACRRDSQ